MSKNDSATHTQLSPQGKPSSSFITENTKTGDLGSDAISVKSMGANASTEVQEVSEDFGSKSGSAIKAEEMEPAGRPSSSFINTSAIK